MREEKKCIFDMTTQVLMMRRRYDESFQNYKDLEKYFSDIKDDDLLPKVLFRLADIHRYKGEQDKVWPLYERSISMAMEREKRSGIDSPVKEEVHKNKLKSYNNYGNIEVLYDESLLPRTKLITEKLHIGMTAFEMANYHYGKGELASAIEGYKTAQQYGELKKDPVGTVMAITQLARILHDHDSYDMALRLYAQILKE